MVQENLREERKRTFDEMEHELLDDMDFVYDKVKCRKIEAMLPQLNKMIETEL